MTVLEARDRVGGRVEQVELPDGRRVQLGGEVVGNAHTAYLGPGGRAGSHAGAVVRRRARRDHPAGARVRRHRHLALLVRRRRHRLLRDRRGGAGEGGRQHRPGRSVRPPRPAPARPAQRRRLPARRGCHPGRAARVRPGPPEPGRRVHRAQSTFAYARKQAVGGGTGGLRRAGVGEPAGRRGVGHGGAHHGGRPGRRTPRDAGLPDRDRVPRLRRHHGRRGGGPRRRGRARRPVRSGARPRDHRRHRRTALLAASPASRVGGEVRGGVRPAVLARHRAERALRERGRARAPRGRSRRGCSPRWCRRSATPLSSPATRRPATREALAQIAGMYGDGSTDTCCRPGPVCGAPTRGRRATSPTGGPATSRPSVRCTAPTSRRSTCVAPTSGWPVTWKGPSAPVGRPRAQHWTGEVS